MVGLSDPLPYPVEKQEIDDIVTIVYAGKAGQVVYRNDGIRTLVEAKFGEKLILRCALRDRQLDGTELSSPLTIYPNMDPACNRLPGPDFHAAELSIYSWDPNSYLDGLDVEGTVGHFIADPDFYIWRKLNPALCFKLWEQAFFLGRAPWQIAKPMSGVPAHFVKEATRLLKEIGYHRLDAVPSWFNVARFFDRLGFDFTYGEQNLAYAGIVEGLRSFTATGKHGARTLSSAQEAWIVALQNLPTEYIPKKLRLPARWSVTHTNSYWIRMHKDLNPYKNPDSLPASDLMGSISSFNALDQVPEVEVHTTSRCPCTDTLGASSPAATGPQALAPEVRSAGKSEETQPAQPPPSEPAEKS
jgi:hypothetical protein